ncbi:MAG: DUF4833 domain-containing protein [Bacteroidota bacterium]
MYLPPKDKRDDYNIRGLMGLPENYPIPDVDDMLFYIQRNQNPNTVIYKIRKNQDGNFLMDDPIYVFWRQYDNNGKDKPLNYIQRKLAYGYEYNIINNDAIQMNIVSYPSYKLFITKNDDQEYKAVGKINNMWAELSNVYVFVEEQGAFPVVKYLELYGLQIETGLPCYEKIDI